MREKPMTLPELARETGFSYRQIRAWASRPYDPLPSVLVGASQRHRRVFASDFDKWLLRETARARRAVR